MNKLPCMQNNPLLSIRHAFALLTGRVLYSSSGHRPRASQITPALALSFIHSFISASQLGLQ